MRARRYTAGVYALLPGGMQALPSFKDPDGCAAGAGDAAGTAERAAKSSGCFRVSSTLEAEGSSDSDTQPATPVAEAVRGRVGFRWGLRAVMNTFWWWRRRAPVASLTWLALLVI